MSLCAIILAAGDGKRMQSNTPKMLHKFAGIPILSRVITTTLNMPSLQQIIVVAGAHIEKFKEVCSDLGLTSNQQKKMQQVVWAYQQFPLGTADAVITGLSQLHSDIEKVLVISGDLPLISTNTLNNLIDNTPITGIGMVTAIVDDPYGLGRIIRDQQGKFLKIVEQVEANPAEAALNEINVGVYLFSKSFLEQQLPKLNSYNVQKEYYITDAMSLAVENKLDVCTIYPDSHLESFSVNTRKQLIELERSYQLQQAYRLIENGVTVIDPKRLDIRGEVEIAKDVEIDINVVLAGNVIIEQGAKIGANCYIQDAVIGQEVIIEPNTVVQGALIDQYAKIGPFARIRPKTHIKSYAKIGNFVEIKASSIGEKSKVNHLGYIGDTSMGSNVNIGAGSITCNYDGINKYETVIEDHVLIGAGCQLIAPITVGAHATIAAGTTLLKNAPIAKLTLNKKIQYSIEWQKPDKEAAAKINEKFKEILEK